MQEITRIVVVGKTGMGKSSVANTIFGEKVFEVYNSANSGTAQCESFTKEVHGRVVKWIDTPGLFDTDQPEEKMKPEILKCITECHPGPHIFLILLRVGRFTAHEEEVVKRLSHYFSDRVLDFAILLFTHGDELDDGTNILDFACENESLKKLLLKCKKRCHVVDNKRWVRSSEGYRSNRHQVSELFRTIDELMSANGGQHYTNSLLQENLQKIMVEAYRYTAGALLLAFLGHAILK